MWTEGKITCRGFSRYWNLRSILAPWRPPLLGLMKTKRGRVLGGGVIWKDMAGCCCSLLPNWKVWNKCVFGKFDSWKKTSVHFKIYRVRQVFYLKLTELVESGVWLSDLLWFCEKDRCRSRTTGQMAVGGKICIRCSPILHSGFTWDAHLLCNWNNTGKRWQNYWARLTKQPRLSTINQNYKIKKINKYKNTSLRGKAQSSSKASVPHHRNRP